MSEVPHPAIAGAQPSQRAEKDPEAPLFEGAYKERFDRILTRYPNKRAALLPVLHLAQEIRGWISPETMSRVAELLDLTPAYVRSITSFYTMFSMRPLGRHLIQVCVGIGCDLCGAEEVTERFLELTKTRIGETSEDGRYTVVEVECLGACAFPTVVQVNDKVYESVTAEDIEGLLKELD
ncbi:MAG: NAD(P)H-dependent oxidoreductase subunit E [Gemmatimonadales bacterium]|jgi:NADH-quinone oxidoreductase E subunit